MNSYVPPPARELVARIRNMKVNEAEVAKREQREQVRFRPGPLQKGFTFDGLSKREVASARFVQLLMPLRAAVNAGDRTEYRRLVPEFDAAAAVLEKFLDSDLDESLGADSRDPDAIPYGAMIRSGFTDWE